MPTFSERVGAAIRAAQNPQRVVADTPHRYEGFKENGAVVMTDRRGQEKAELPIDTKGVGGSDPLAIWRPDGAKHVDAGKAMANFTNWSYAAVNAIASEIANIQWRLYKVDGDDHTEQDDHPLLTLLEGVNPHMTGIELKYVTAAHLELTGNAFWLLDGVAGDEDQPKAVYPLNPANVVVKVNKATFPYKLSHYEMTLDGNVYKFQPHQIVHIKYPDPNDPFVGIGVPQSIPTWVDSDNYAMEWNRKFFVNGANIGQFITTESNVEGQIERIKKGFDEKYTGTDNAHKIPVLPKGVKLEHTGLSQKDMDFGNLADATRDRILAGYRVSKTILGTAESDTNRSTAETADYVFSKRTIKPKMLLVLSYLNEFLVPRYGDDIYLTFIDPVPEDKAARTTEMQAAVANLPVMTQNEARKNFMGLGPVEGGDQLYALGTMTPAGTTDQTEGEDLSPNLVRTVDGWDAKAIRIRKGGKTAFSATFKMRSELTEAFARQLDAEGAYVFKSVKDLSHGEYMEHYKRFDRRSDQARRELEKAFLAVNNDQREEVLAALPDATGVTKAAGDLFDAQKWIAVVVDLATPIILALGKDESTAALQMIGAGAPTASTASAVRDALEAGIGKMARSYTQTTLDQLTEKIGEKLSQPGGTDLAELTQAVDDVYAFADERRAGLIAKTEAYRASNTANLTAWKDSGVVNTVMWYTAEDDRVCPECDAMDGTEIDIGTSFFDDDYSDGSTPPAHPDCRCYIRPEDISL